MKKTAKITKQIAKKVLDVVDKGLVRGVGDPVPGEMCVEAAVCYAMGEPHGDQPSCVNGMLGNFKIELNDVNGWKSKKSRAKGLRRLAIAQLGTGGNFDADRFNKLMRDMIARTYLPDVVIKELSEGFGGDQEMMRFGKYVASRLREAGTDALTMVMNVADASTCLSNVIDFIRSLQAYDLFSSECLDIDWMTDKELAIFCEHVVQVLIKMKTPGSKFLNLCPVKK